MPPFSPGNRLLVLGAGATRGADFKEGFESSCDPPLNADFFTQLQRITDDKYTVLVREVISDVVDLFGSNFSLTLEDYFTQLEFLLETMRIAPSTAGNITSGDLRAKRDRLLNAVPAVIEMSTDAAIRASDGCQRHEHLVNHLRAKDTVISFNYDCVMDHALRQHGSKKWSATYGYTFPNPARISGTEVWNPTIPGASSKETVFLLKLHGSLNWQLPDESDVPAAARHKKAIKLKQRLHGQRGVPYFTIIPPVSNKAIQDDPAFHVLWKNAERAIRNAERIAIVGFSFAATDLPVESLFRVALAGRQSKLKSLVIVNKAEAHRRRTREVFSKPLEKGTVVRQYDDFEHSCRRSPAASLSQRPPNSIQLARGPGHPFAESRGPRCTPTGQRHFQTGISSSPPLFARSRSETDRAVGFLLVARSALSEAWIRSFHTARTGGKELFRSRHSWGYRPCMLVRSREAPNWHSPKTTAYEDEAELRELIADSPSLLPGIDERPVAVTTELQVPAVGQTDVVVVDADGEITIVECKLAKNAEIRRWVIGQAFSYAAGLWRLGYEELEQGFAARGADLAASFTNDPDWDNAAFRDAVSETLTNGAFRLVIAVDDITDELKRTVVYINRQTGPELRLLALELRYAVDEGVEILLPEVYGVESAEEPPGRTKRHWDEEGVFAALREVQEPELAERLIRLYEWMRDAGARASWGTGAAAGVTMWLGEDAGNPVVVGFYAGPGSYPGGMGGLTVSFDFVRDKRPPAEMQRLADLLREVPGVAPYLQGLEEKNWSMHGGMDPAKVLASDEALEAWKRALAQAAAPVST